MVLKPQMKGNTSVEDYELNHNFTVTYIRHKLGSDDDPTPLSEHVVLLEHVQNMYPNPNNDKTFSISGEYETKPEIVKEVSRDLSQAQNLVHIRQWRPLPAGLDDLINQLPEHVKELLIISYSVPGVKPFYFESDPNDFFTERYF